MFPRRNFFSAGIGLLASWLTLKPVQTAPESPVTTFATLGDDKYHIKDGKIFCVEYKRPCSNDTKITFYNEAGEIHRENGPAIEHANGWKEWWVHGRLVQQTDINGNLWVSTANQP
jgi:hypothetical protein